MGVLSSQAKSDSKTAVSAYSGGLDSTLVLIFLREKYGFDNVVPVLVDVGQGEEEIQTAFERAKILGIEPVFIDAKEEFAREWIFRCIKANGSYQGYPVGTSMTRVLIATKCVEVARKVGATAIAHGCTGKGNDQFRIETTVSYLAPDIRNIAPIREFNLMRAEEEAILKNYGITPKKRRGKLGGDINMWSHSMGSGQVEDLVSQYPEDYLWTVAPEEAPDKPRELKITFERGVPVCIDGIEDPVEMILYLNKVGGENGVGRIDILEDGMIGLKSRELYEAPAATILLKVHWDLEQLTLTKEQLQLKRYIDKLWAEIVYHGMWVHPLRKDLEAFIDSTQVHVNGTYRVKLYKGNVEILERQSDSSLFSPEMRSVKRAGFDQRDSTGAIRIHTVPYQLLGRLGR
ncbi:argininosuccinate synthase [Candidatus Bathyarchaeota archaeon]|nr:argininosuccinate synthase [Candidatus Bathyarchaeota archaeon]